MNLIPWRSKQAQRREKNGRSPTAIEQFRSEMDRLFERFFRDPWGAAEDALAPMTGWGPSVDVSETDADITVRAEIPGVDAKDLQVSITGDVLTLAGEKQESSERESENYYHSERRFGAFRRSIALPAGADPDKIDAEYRDGVLTVRIGKTPAAAPKKIAVKAT
jgi:HSP20 family protein